MPTEVTEILDNVHQMSSTKRFLIGAGTLLIVVATIVAVFFLIK